MQQYKAGSSIKYWAEDDRPRDKLLLKGRYALSDSELLAIILGTGTQGETALDLGKKLLHYADNNLLELSRFSVTDLVKTKGIGKSKAVTLLAALELGNRKHASEAIRKQKISCSRDAYEYLNTLIADKTYEEFWILILNRGNRIIKAVSISEGGSSGTVADPKKIFKIALEHRGSAIILSHNHPSGDPKPSEADIKLTRKMKEAGLLLELPIIDHIIIGNSCYYSFADVGMI